jgi:hypothetical protein
VRVKALECLRAAVVRLEAESAKMSEEVALQGGGPVAPPTMSDAGVMGWASSSATSQLSKTLWGVSASDSMGKGDAGLAHTNSANSSHSSHSSNTKAPASGVGAAAAAGKGAVGGASGAGRRGGGGGAGGGGADGDGWGDEAETLAAWAAPETGSKGKKAEADGFGWGDDAWGEVEGGSADASKSGGGAAKKKLGTPYYLLYGFTGTLVHWYTGTQVQILKQKVHAQQRALLTMAGAAWWTTSRRPCLIYRPKAAAQQRVDRRVGAQARQQAQLREQAQASNRSRTLTTCWTTSLELRLRPRLAAARGGTAARLTTTVGAR